MVFWNTSPPGVTSRTGGAGGPGRASGHAFVRGDLLSGASSRMIPAILHLSIALSGGICGFIRFFRHLRGHGAAQCPSSVPDFLSEEAALLGSRGRALMAARPRRPSRPRSPGDHRLHPRRVHAPQVRPDPGHPEPGRLRPRGPANQTGTLQDVSVTPQIVHVRREHRRHRQRRLDPAGRPVADDVAVLHRAGRDATAPFGPFPPSQTCHHPHRGTAFDDFASGPGNINLTFLTATRDTVTGGGGNIHETIATTAGASATVTYTYTYQPVSLSGNVYDDQAGTGASPPATLPSPASS